MPLELLVVHGATLGLGGNLTLGLVVGKTCLLLERETHTGRILVFSTWSTWTPISWGEWPMRSDGKEQTIMTIWLSKFHSSIQGLTHSHANTKQCSVGTGCSHPYLLLLLNHGEFLTKAQTSEVFTVFTILAARVSSLPRMTRVLGHKMLRIYVQND